MMRDIYNALPIPDDRPITSLCVIEDASASPPNYTAVSKTHDQDIDADLCKEGFFKKISRYLCHSKTEGFFGYVVENIVILNEKDTRPPGYTIIDQTTDTSQKAFRKKQLCYKAVPRNMAIQTITDIIILSRSKVAPEGFTLFGEMNGLSICYKLGTSTGSAAIQPQISSSSSSPLPYSVTPNNSRGSVSSLNSGVGGLYPGLPDGQRSRFPTRQAPNPPGREAAHPEAYDASLESIYDSAQSAGTRKLQSLIDSQISGLIDWPQSDEEDASDDKNKEMETIISEMDSLSGVPFIFNKKYVETNTSPRETLPSSHKSSQQVEDEYYYSFTLEQDLLQRAT